jgi:hypothetical protein
MRRLALAMLGIVSLATLAAESPYRAPRLDTGQRNDAAGAAMQRKE